MANLKEVRSRIASVKNTQQITSAMKMVSASKLRKAQNAIQKMRPYDEKLHNIMRHISGDVDQEQVDSVYTTEREVEKVLLVVISSNRGLCGSFNTNVIKKAESRIEEDFQSHKENSNLFIYAIGKKVFQYFNREGYQTAGHEEEMIEKPEFEPVRELSGLLMKQFAEGEYDRIEIVYNQFKNAATQILKSEKFLPVTTDEEQEDAEQKTDAEYLYEPDQETILLELLPKTLKVQLYKILLDSHAAEHGARMTAMHQATENAKELLRELQLAYNKARQAAITNELMEITSGADALKG
ncbi:MAG: ATP synthase F1 subunit gamma [Bacteroidales bacterium]|nr:ATP synthase F1 subunit gamma [Bacteroidales bacterium]